MRLLKENFAAHEYGHSKTHLGTSILQTIEFLQPVPDDPLGLRSLSLRTGEHGSAWMPPDLGARD